MLENVRNSIEVGVRKVLTPGSKKKNFMTQAEENKQISKVFGVSLCTLCNREQSTVPFIVRDICTFIKNHHAGSEGIFRLSAPSREKSKLRQAFEDCSTTEQYQTAVCSTTDIDGHTAANVLKQFLRELSEPLVPDYILQLSQETKCLSDEAFAAKVRTHLTSWPETHQHTLQYLLRFFQPIMRNVDNRMNGTGLAVVLGPNIFRIPNGPGGLEIQTLANYTVERLLRTFDVICSCDKDDQGYLKMTSSPKNKVKRIAPPVPMQARPLPPPTVPVHAPNNLMVRSAASAPSVPARSKSLSQDYETEDPRISMTCDSSTCTDQSDADDAFSEQSADDVLMRNHDVVMKTISHVVRKNLFSGSSSSSCVEEEATSVPLHHSELRHDDVTTSPYRDGATTPSLLHNGLQRDSVDVTLIASGDDDSSVTTLLPSLTAGRNAGPRRRKPTRSLRRRAENITGEKQEKVEVPEPMPRRKAKVPIVDLESGDSIAESGISDEKADFSLKEAENEDLISKEKNLSNIESSTAPTAVVTPQFLIEDISEGDKLRPDVTEEVPSLDLSGVASSDENVRPRPLPRKNYESPARVKRRKRKGNKSSPTHTQVKHSPVQTSEPINIPVSAGCHKMEEPEKESLPQEGSLKWRDAWSTDDETVAMGVAMENAIKRDSRYSNDFEENVEVAPSSPENHVALHHSSYAQRRMHRRHRNHGHRSSKVEAESNSSKDSEEDYSNLLSSFDNIQQALIEERKKSGRPEDLTLMTRDEIRAEKIAMQKELLKHEEKHGRPSSKMEKDIMRTIYERYRTVKRLLVDSTAPPFNNPMNRRLDDSGENYDAMMAQHTDDFAVTNTLLDSPTLSDELEGSTKNNPFMETAISITSDLGVSELKKHHKEAKGQRRRLRRKLQEFEKEIEQQYGRPITQADKVVMATEYQEYRALKAKMRLLGALIEKHAANSP